MLPNKKEIKKAFTLAEILIVLVIIGILTLILLPVAFQSSPDKEVMKFKKGNNTLLTVIKELVSSDEYYQDGDLGIRAGGEMIDGEHDDDITYFCETFADVISTKSVNCSKNTICKNQYCWNHLGVLGGKEYCDMEKLKKTADEACLNSEEAVGAEIVSNDDIIFYQVSPIYTFGITGNNASFANNSSEEVEMSDEQIEWHNKYNTKRKALDKNDDGFVSTYKFICMDIDGIKKGNNPFGYALRYDGKVILGALADEWMKKTIQKQD